MTHHCCDHDHAHDHDHDHHHDHHHGHGHHHGSRPAKPGILLAAFGVAIEEARSGYDLFETEARQRHPGVHLAWAYTAHKVRRKLAGRGAEYDSVAVALSKLHDEGVTHLAVQSLHTTPGVEYHWTRDQAMAYRHPRKGFLDVRMGAPLLATEQDLELSCAALSGYIPSERTPEQAVVLVGHGTYHEAHQRYLDFEVCARRGDPLLFMGALMGRPHCADVVEALQSAGVREVWLLPFMSVPGHHVRVDLYGEGERSWQSRMRLAGLTVHTRLTGSLEHKPFRDIWLQHLDAACAVHQAGR
jgi:sirohydrochlorin cobaltochelatase